MLKSAYLDLVILAFSLSLILNRALWPSAILAIAFIFYKAFQEYVASNKPKDTEVGLKERISSIENKMTIMGLSKRQ